MWGCGVDTKGKFILSPWPSLFIYLFIHFALPGLVDEARLEKGMLHFVCVCVVGVWCVCVVLILCK